MTEEEVRCIECGERLPAERAELGYRYCTKRSCQEIHHPGLAITTFGVNKSADQIIVADPDELRRPGRAGEFGRKDTEVGLDYRQPAPPVPRPGPAKVPAQRRAPARRPWTAEQEKIVRLYHEMGLSPSQITARAREYAPRLRITEALVVKIMSVPPRRT
ncbi:hypothetical protein ACLFMI_11210 [Pseudonocardia nantongensis]|uniref:hypothetical protein n=1 Tax=Pseudonocardia nantongensis TaxID=1181885 RepID=UPI00397E7676